MNIDLFLFYSIIGIIRYQNFYLYIVIFLSFVTMIKKVLKKKKLNNNKRGIFEWI